MKGKNKVLREILGIVMVIFQIKVGHFSIPLFYQIMFNHI